jgi:hypothetical protein
MYVGPHGWTVPVSGQGAGQDGREVREAGLVGGRSC